MTLEILATKSFEQALRQHPHPHVVYKKIQFLAENPYHPSLNGHQLNQVRGRNIWDAYISNSERSLYELKDGILRLWDLGSHSIVDKAHLHKYSEHKLMQHLNIMVPVSWTGR